MSGQGASAGYRCGVLVLTLALVVGSVSWLRAWWRQGAGAGCRCWALVARVVGTGCRCGVLVSGAGAAYGAGAGAVSWLRAVEIGRRRWALGSARGGDRAPAVGAGSARGGDRLPVPGAGAGCCGLAARVADTHCRRWVPLQGAGCARGGGVHTFARINLHAQDHTLLWFYRSLLQACYKVNGYYLALGQWHLWGSLFARIRAHTRKIIGCHSSDSQTIAMGF